MDWPGAALLEANETDDDDTTASESASRPVVVSIRSSMPVVNSGNAFYVAINLDGDARISCSLVVLDFDANLIEVRRVANGGLLRGDPQFTTQGGKLRIRLEQSASNGSIGGDHLRLRVTGTRPTIVNQAPADVISAATLFVEQQSFPDQPRREPSSSGRGQYRAGR